MTPRSYIENNCRYCVSYLHRYIDAETEDALPGERKLTGSNLLQLASFYLRNRRTQISSMTAF